MSAVSALASARLIKRFAVIAASCFTTAGGNEFSPRCSNATILVVPNPDSLLSEERSTEPQGHGSVNGNISDGFGMKTSCRMFLTPAPMRQDCDALAAHGRIVRVCVTLAVSSSYWSVAPRWRYGAGSDPADAHPLDLDAFVVIQANGGMMTDGYLR